MVAREEFDYGEMEQAARRECQALRERLAQRRRELPPPGELLRWKRENSMLYTMYLEQRHNQILFARRDRDRRQGKEACLWSERS